MEHLASSLICLDLRLFGGWKKIFPKMVVKNGDESRGRIRKTSPIKLIKQTKVFECLGWFT